MSLTILTRADKGSVLTHAEVDTNFENIKAYIEALEALVAVSINGSGQLKDATVHSISVLSATVQTAIRIPPGTLAMHAGSLPAGWLECDGYAVSRATYADLFTAIGVVYGAGDSSTTFNLPDFRGRSPLGIGQGNTAEGGVTGTNRTLGQIGGAENHTLLAAELASHKHQISHGHSRADDESPDNYGLWVASGDGYEQSADDTDEDGGDDNPHNNMHPWLAVRFIIKY